MKKNLLIFIYNMEIGGIERSLVNMLNNFNYEMYSIDLLICNHTGELMKHIPNEVNVLPELPQFTVFRKSILQCFKHGYHILAAVRLLTKVYGLLITRTKNYEEGSGYIQMQLSAKYLSKFLPKIKGEYDLAISYAWPHNIVANNVIAKKKMAWVHTDFSKLEVNNKLDLLHWEEFDYIASVSDECTKSFLKIYPSLEQKVIKIENITSPNFIQTMKDKVKVFMERANNKNIIILSVGRLSYVKGYDLAIKALRKLHDSGLKHIKWYVIGYGNYEKELKEMIKTYQLEDSFILLGKKENPYPYMAQCDIYVQPSRYEGKAVTVTEAKILGKPIIITDYPTAKSQIENDIEGIICNMSVEGIANAIEKLLENNELKDEIIRNNKNKKHENIEEIDKLYSLIG